MGNRFFHTGEIRPEATISYWVKDDQGEEVSLVIRESSAGRDGDGGGDPGESPGGAGREAGESEEGEVIRRLSGPGEAGLHRVSWDLERDEPRPRELGGPTSRSELREVRAGEYTVTLEIGDTTRTRTITVREGWVRETPGRIR